MANIAFASRTYATIRYWLLRVEQTGNQPVWSVATIPVGSYSVTVLKVTKFVWALGLEGQSNAVMIWSSSLVEVRFLVLHRFFLVCLRWPFAVSSNSGRCLLMREVKSPGKVAKKNSTFWLLVSMCTGLGSSMRGVNILRGQFLFVGCTHWKLVCWFSEVAHCWWLGSLAWDKVQMFSVSSEDNIFCFNVSDSGVLFSESGFIASVAELTDRVKQFVG